MTKRELIEAFLRGDVDRRQFVNRLGMLGVSGGAAIAYAASLAPGAAAAPATSASGFAMRAQDLDDEEYGTAFEFASDDEAIALAIAAIEDVLAVLESLSEFTADDFDDGVFDTLNTMLEQQQEHQEALSALFGAPTGTGDGGESFASAEEFLAALASSLDDLTALYAAVVPAISDGEVRQTAMEIASVASRHAALASTFAEQDPIPETFQTASIPE